MKQHDGDPSRQPPAGASGGARRWAWLGLPTVALVVAGVIAARQGRPVSSSVALPKVQVTFTEHVAPILFQHCAACHRPGQSGPFDLLTFRDAQKRARQIADVTARRLMPPWPPEPESAEFVGQRVLSRAEVEILRRWADGGAVEGPPEKLPSPPRWPADWALGRPDLIVTPPQPFALRADGRDVYRIFVTPIPGTASRYVRAVELRPGTRAAHHAFILLDGTGESRRRDAEDPEPGFEGIHTPPGAQSPAGHFLSWQPGRGPTVAPAGLAWRLEPGLDLVLQMHLQPTGKPEAIQPSLGFYFTDQPPTNALYKSGLMKFDLDIPAGATRHAVEDSFRVAADCDLLSVLPHAHFLAREIEAWAVPPGGRKQTLFAIKNWDFNWQGDYRYVRPIFLPKGTVVHAQYTFDNSTNNVRNPHQPPQRVRYGLQSTDEMAELWLQLLPRRREDADVLAQEDQPRVARDAIAYGQYLLRLNPRDARAYSKIAVAQLSLRETDEAQRNLRRALELDVNLEDPHYYLGLLHRSRGQHAEAQAEFAATLRINPAHYKAHGNLGFIALERGDLASASTHFQNALRANPNDTLARQGLDEVRRRGGK